MRLRGRFMHVVLALVAGTAVAQEVEGPPPASAITRRVLLEEELAHNPFVIVPHRPTYVLPLSYVSNQNDDATQSAGSALDNLEMKFQVSLKIPLAKDLVGGHTRLYFGYTQVSFWQAYNRNVSAPFRETNHEPELMLSFIHERNVLGFRSRVLTLGLSHQSNGQSGLSSRSWNRAYANFILERGDVYYSFKPWIRIPEPAKTDVNDPTGDDNPDIESYLGNFELRTLYSRGETTVGVMLRNNFRADNRGAIEVEYTYPIGDQARGYVQYFNGYGENLIDYNHTSSRLGVGVMLVNWL